MVRGGSEGIHEMASPEQKAAKKALFTAIQHLADSASNFDGETAAVMIREAANAYHLTLPLPPGGPAYRRGPGFEPKFSEL